MGNCNKQWLEHTYCQLREKRDGEYFKKQILSRLLVPIEISTKWVSKNTNYKEPDFYSGLFDDPEKGPFEVPTGRIKER